MAKDVAEATESLDKEAGLVGLDRPLDQLDLTKMLSESIDVEEQDIGPRRYRRVAMRRWKRRR